jgi:hypothetical protein
MKHTVKGILTLLFALFIFNSTNAQIFQFGVSDHAILVLGNFSNNDFNSKDAGYVEFADGASLEFKYINKKNWGFGVRATYSFYTRDTASYQADLLKNLGVTNDNFYVTNLASFRSFNFLFGVSRVLSLSEKFQFEPYFYIGMKSLTDPGENVVYSINSTTLTYSKNPMVYVGFSYIPGLKFQWNINKYVGLNLFVEYEGVAMETRTEESIIYNDNNFDKTRIEKSYMPQSINLGLGLAFSFGKGLKDK